MSLYKRPGSRFWWVKITAPGHPTVRESAGTEDRAAAQEYHDKRAAELWRLRRLGERPRTAFADAAADWLTTTSAHKRTHETDRARLRIMLPLLPPWLDQLTTAKLTEIRDALRQPRQVQITSSRGATRTVTRTVGQNTANKMLSVLSSILRHAHARGWIDAMPAVPAYRKVKRQRFTLLTPEQAATFMAELPPHLQAMARFGLATGLRDANLRGLRWQDVDLSARVARVWPDEARAGQAIPVPLNAAAIEVLQAQLGRHPVYVFVYERLRATPSGDAHAVVVGRQQTARGERVIERLPVLKRSNNSAWRKARARAGVERLRVHDLRHTWATWHAMAGTGTLELQQMGGWSDARMLTVYTHLAASHLVQHADRISVPAPGTAKGTGGSAGTEKAATEADIPKEISELGGVADGIRTHNNWNHNRGAVVVPLVKSDTCRERGKAQQKKKRA